jgi:hypothetical protein
VVAVSHGKLVGRVIDHGHSVRHCGEESTRDEFIRARYGESDEVWVEIQVCHSSTMSERYDQDSWLATMHFPDRSVLWLRSKFDYEKYNHAQDRDEWTNLDEALRKLAAVGCRGVALEDVQAVVMEMFKAV